MRRRRSPRTGSAVVKDDDQWRQELGPQEYAVLREGATERAGSGQYAHPGERGVYRCGACRQELFASDDQYDSGTGWPSFTAPVSPEAVQRVRDVGLLGVRTEVRCRSCASHLGHVFRDGPGPTGERFCMNSVALVLEP